MGRVGKALSALALAVGLTGASGCASVQALQNNPQAFHTNIAESKYLTENGRNLAYIVDGAPWRGPSSMQQTVDRIVGRFRQTGLITIPNGLVQPSDCFGSGADAVTLEDGRVLLCRDLFLNAQSEDEIAFVIGHELGHIVRRHNTSDGIPGGILTTGMLTALVAAAALHDPTGSWTQLPAMFGLMGASEIMAGSYNATWKLPQELEADQVGIDLVAKAGYSPEVAIAYLQSLGQPRALLTPQEMANSTPHPDFQRRVEESKSYVAKWAYPEPENAYSPIAWVENLDADPEMLAYTQGLAEMDKAIDLGIGINMLMVQAGDRNATRTMRDTRQSQARELCNVAGPMARTAVSATRGDRWLVQQAAAVLARCNPREAFDLLLGEAWSERGGIYAVDDLIGYMLWQDLDALEPQALDVWRARVVPRAYSGQSFEIALKMAEQYLRSNFAEELVAECEKHAPETGMNCGWVSFQKGWEAGTDENGKRSWTKILEHVQAPTVRLMMAMEDRAYAELNAGHGLPPLARATLDKREIERRTAAATTIELNLRALPSTNGAVIAVIPRGTAVKLLGETSGSWSKISYNGFTGWVSTRYLAQDKRSGGK